MNMEVGLLVDVSSLWNMFIESKTSTIYVLSIFPVVLLAWTVHPAPVPTPALAASYCLPIFPTV
jgi:hypothetical protein